MAQRCCQRLLCEQSVAGDASVPMGLPEPRLPPSLLARQLGVWPQFCSKSHASTLNLLCSDRPLRGSRQSPLRFLDLRLKSSGSFWGESASERLSLGSRMAPRRDAARNSETAVLFFRWVTSMMLGLTWGPEGLVPGPSDAWAGCPWTVVLGTVESYTPWGGQGHTWQS